MANVPRKFVLWRRPRGTTKPWVKLDGAHDETAAAMKAVSDAELAAPPDDYEYSVQWEGVIPPQYATRELRPRRG